MKQTEVWVFFWLLNILHQSMCTNNITVCISNLTDATSLVDMNEHRPQKYSLNHLLDWPLLNTNSFRKPAFRKPIATIRTLNTQPTISRATFRRCCERPQARICIHMISQTQHFEIKEKKRTYGSFPKVILHASKAGKRLMVPRA